MSNVIEFTKYTDETAPKGADVILAGAKKNFGFLPEPLARMAESPAIVEAFMSANGIFGKTSLTPLEREVLVMRVATGHGCEYCVAMHTGLLKKVGAADELIEKLRSRDTLNDAHLQAMIDFVDELQLTHGAVRDESLQAFLDAGYTKQQSLEVVLGISVYTMSTYANRLTKAPLDDAFEKFRWEMPSVS